MIQLFDFFSFLIILSIIMIILSYNPIHSIFWLVLVFLFSSGLLISIGLDFMSLSIIIIYVGAIAILFLFVIMMLDLVNIKISSIKNLIPIFIIIIFNVIIKLILINKSFYNSTLFLLNWKINNLNQINLIGKLLYSEYYYSFIIISIILFIAMIGAIVLTLEINKLTKKQNLIIQHQR